MEKPIVPIFIIARDRVSYLDQLVCWCKRARGFEKDIQLEIVIIDNDSSFPPMLAYLDRINVRVVKFGRNRKMMSPWDSGMVDEYKAPFFVITDCDVVPDGDCPLDAVSMLIDTLKQYSSIDKAGLSLITDNLPDHYEHKDRVHLEEHPYSMLDWDYRFHYAPIDTTFAVWRYGLGYGIGRCLRSKAPYTARHLPWYEDSSNLTEEIKYYKEHSDPAGTRAY